MLKTLGYCAKDDPACGPKNAAQGEPRAARQNQPDGGANGRAKDDPESNDAVAPVVRSALAQESHPPSGRSARLRSPKVGNGMTESVGSKVLRRSQLLTRRPGGIGNLASDLSVPMVQPDMGVEDWLRPAIPRTAPLGRRSRCHRGRMRGRLQGPKPLPRGSDPGIE